MEVILKEPVLMKFIVQPIVLLLNYHKFVSSFYSSIKMVSYLLLSLMLGFSSNAIAQSADRLAYKISMQMKYYPEPKKSLDVYYVVIRSCKLSIDYKSPKKKIMSEIVSESPISDFDFINSKAFPDKALGPFGKKGAILLQCKQDVNCMKTDGKAVNKQTFSATSYQNLDDLLQNLQDYQNACENDAKTKRTTNPEKVAEKPKKVVASDSSTPKNTHLQKIAKSCKSCHGDAFQKKALGKSKVIKEMSYQEIKAALLGYKNRTYGGPMKGIMYGQVAKLTESDIEAISSYIQEYTK